MIRAGDMKSSNLVHQSADVITGTTESKHEVHNVMET